jgi:two-component system, cell cycle response regulator DivK
LQFVLDQQNLLFARNGHEAIRMAYEHQPDIILMDLTLPKLSGWEAARSLKSDKQFRDTPILALTAHAMTGDRAKALEAGCDDYFTKPIDVDAFIKFMKPYLSAVLDKDKISDKKDKASDKEEVSDKDEASDKKDKASNKEAHVNIQPRGDKS